MNNIEILDGVLLGDDVLNNFNKVMENNEFSEWLISVLPEVEDCANQQQNNPWHIYNVLDHILVSVDKMNKQTENMSFEDRRLLAYTMFLHDIAKPMCHIARMKNGKMIDSFYANGGHSVRSAEIAKRVYSDFGFSAKDGKVLERLVCDHDIFMNLTTNNTTNPYLKQLNNDVVLEEIQRLNEVGNGYDLIYKLVKVGKADNGAQNHKMTGSALSLLEQYEKIADNLVSLK